MPRKGHIQKRDVLADPVYNNKVVTKLINNIMLDGKKGVAQKIVYGAFEQVAEKSGKDAIEVFEEAMNNIMPQLEVKARRIGGATYQVPIEVRPDRRQALALSWLTFFSRLREQEKTMKERLANEILDAANNTGAAVKRKRRYAQDGRSKQGICSLQMVMLRFAAISGSRLAFLCLERRRQWSGWKRISHLDRDKKHRYHGAYRRR